MAKLVPVLLVSVQVVNDFQMLRQKLCVSCIAMEEINSAITAPLLDGLADSTYCHYACLEIVGPQQEDCPGCNITCILMSQRSWQDVDKSPNWVLWVHSYLYC